jgi:hypothetical protein
MVKETGMNRVFAMTIGLSSVLIVCVIGLFFLGCSQQPMSLDVIVRPHPAYSSPTDILVSIEAADMGGGRYLLETSSVITGWESEGGDVGNLGTSRRWVLYLRSSELPCKLMVLWTDGVRAATCQVAIEDQG